MTRTENLNIVEVLPITSPKKLMDYQRKYFENELIPIDIEKTNTITVLL